MSTQSDQRTVAEASALLGVGAAATLAQAIDLLGQVPVPKGDPATATTLANGLHSSIGALAGAGDEIRRLATSRLPAVWTGQAAGGAHRSGRGYSRPPICPRHRSAMS